jgi:hypothetical protein
MKNTIMKNVKKPAASAKSGKASQGNIQDNKSSQMKNTQRGKKGAEGLEQHGSIKNSK